MYAIVEIKGKQYKVEEGKYIDVDYLGKEKEHEMKFDKILAISNNGNIKFGTPYIENAVIKAKVIDNFKGKKVIAYKYRKRKDSHKKKGHRSLLSRIEIQKIEI